MANVAIREQLPLHLPSRPSTPRVWVRSHVPTWKFEELLDGVIQSYYGKSQRLPSAIRVQPENRSKTSAYLRGQGWASISILSCSSMFACEVDVPYEVTVQ